nr:chromosome segregation protein SMC [Propionibacterium sp.]
MAGTPGGRVVDDPLGSALAAAEDAEQPAQRYLLAHLAALRIAAEALAGRPRRRGALHSIDGTHRNVWAVLPEVAPELGEWAEYFAALQLKRQAVAAGAVGLVGEREADDLIRDVRAFRAAVALGRRWRAAADARGGAGRAGLGGAAS